jgi:hypothetical protein
MNEGTVIASGLRLRVQPEGKILMVSSPRK